MLTYGDGLGNVNIKELVEFHKRNGKMATVTAVQPSAGRFGALGLGDEYVVRTFKEKPASDGIWINGGFFVLEPGIFEYITEGDSTVWERMPLENLAKDNQLVAFKHFGFWRPMDTLRDRTELGDMWDSGNAKWKIW